MSACPTCGVAVVPGYVKCPKCGHALPAVARTRSSSFGGGGTAVTDRGATSAKSLYLVLAGGVAIAVALILVLRGGSGGKTASTANARVTEDTPQPDDDPTPSETAPDTPLTPTPVAAASADDAQTAAIADLDRGLRRQWLWGTVSVVGARVDVRSGACDDQGMTALIDSARPQLHGAGLTKLRCLAQSGAVVFERDL